MRKVHSFLPVIDSDCRILILGSMPSLRSTLEGFYYMHPQNRFWKILSVLYEFDFLSASIEEKKKKLLEHHIALYDVILECDIEASKDASIKEIKPQAIEQLILGTKIDRILLNGQTAYQIFIKNYPNLMDMAVRLPSTSSANARYTLENLIDEWGKHLNK